MIPLTHGVQLGIMPHLPPTHRPTRLPACTGRASSAQRGYDARWRRLRAAVLAERPLCEECLTERATDVDHVVAKAKGGGDDRGNLMALCHSCHSRKTVRCDGGLGRGRGV